MRGDAGTSETPKDVIGLQSSSRSMPTLPGDFGATNFRAVVTDIAKQANTNGKESSSNKHFAELKPYTRLKEKLIVQNEKFQFLKHVVCNETHIVIHRI